MGQVPLFLGPGGYLPSFAPMCGDNACLLGECLLGCLRRARNGIITPSLDAWLRTSLVVLSASIASGCPCVGLGVGDHSDGMAGHMESQIN